MTPAARREFDRLNEQDDRDARIIRRATAKLEAELKAARQRIAELEVDLELTAAELGRMRFAAISAGAEV